MHNWTVITPADQRSVDMTADRMQITPEGQLYFYVGPMLHAVFAHRGWVSVSRTPEAPAA